jgi:hypothetical protein
MDKPKLQELLFRAFERKPNRTLIDLRNYTEQPTVGALCLAWEGGTPV